MHPGNTRSSGTLFDAVNDLDCILRHAGVEKAICMGCMTRLFTKWFPDMLRSRSIKAGHNKRRHRRCHLRQFNLVPPISLDDQLSVLFQYIPPGETFLPISNIVKDYPKLMYQSYFDEKMNEASEGLGKDVRRLLRGTYRTIKNPPPEGFFKSKDAFLHVYLEDEEVLKTSFNLHITVYELKVQTQRVAFLRW